MGQNIAKDVEWLALREGEDFAAMLDLAALLRVWNGSATVPSRLRKEKRNCALSCSSFCAAVCLLPERYHSFTYFGLHHAAQCWLPPEIMGTSQHSAVEDALKSMRLFERYCRAQHSPSELAVLQAKMLETPVAPSFAKSNPTYDNCCMGNRKTCTCGHPVTSLSRRCSRCWPDTRRAQFFS